MDQSLANQARERERFMGGKLPRNSSLVCFVVFRSQSCALVVLVVEPDLVDCVFTILLVRLLVRRNTSGRKAGLACGIPGSCDGDVARTRLCSFLRVFGAWY